MAQGLIRGAAYDSALRPIAGALIEIVGAPPGAAITSNESGEFALSATIDDTTTVRASKSVYVTATAKVLPPCESCSPGWLYFYLDLPISPVAIAGEYTLTLTAAEHCTTLPAELRTRSYPATVALRNVTFPGSGGNTTLSS